jgi:hypothetical protein
MFEAEPLHIEAARELRALADHIEAAGVCQGFVAGAITGSGADRVALGGSSEHIRSIIATTVDHVANATFIHADTDFDALDATEAAAV